MRSTVSTFFFFVALVTCYAQTEHYFKTGIAVAQCHRYGREAIVSDRLAYLLHTGQMKQPEAGAVLFSEDGTEHRWKAVEADSTGRFRGEALMNGYIYLTYNSTRPRNALLNVSGNNMFYLNAEPHGGDIYNDGWMDIPVKLKKGVNELLIRCGNFARWQGVRAKLTFPEKDLLIKVEDATVPHVVVGRSRGDMVGAVVVVNMSDKLVGDLSFTAIIHGKRRETKLPGINPRSIRKLPFYFDPSAVSAKGDYPCVVRLMRGTRVIDEKTVTITAVNEEEHHSYTFISDIDGSVQYYSVAPHQAGLKEKPALFLSVHGAGVQAIGQARAYKPKSWGTLVTPTNRRPRGFNWEDWGRLDALEVLGHATKNINPDLQRIYLTGHSMGGHGTWYLGATYPDKWAAIAPCAGYPTLMGYGSADGKIPENAPSDAEKLLLRASNASNTIALASNYKHFGVYVFHGDSDRVVPVTHARQMRKVLAEFHPDFSYYEYAGGSHWFGNESVDWPPLFDYLRLHTLKHDSVVNVIDFVTANPGISSSFRWASIIQQVRPLLYSRIQLIRDRKAMTITGTTENVAMLKLDLGDFREGDTVSLSIDSQLIHHVVNHDHLVYLSRPSAWRVESNANSRHKNDRRSGTFKEAFNHRMIFVYGTSGNPEENAWAYNKARFDAETWYYRGNGSVDVIADDVFEPAKYPDRGVILYGNAVTNSAWNKLLKDCPLQVLRDRVNLGSRTFQGNDLGAYFIWPRPDSDIASVAVVAGTGPAGLRAADGNQYFAAGSGFPDYMIFSAEMLKSGAAGIRDVGFFDNEWKLPKER